MAKAVSFFAENPTFIGILIILCKGKSLKRLSIISSCYNGKTIKIKG